MAPQPPLILVDSKFDRISLYPAAVLTSSTAVVGREVNFIADYRRERTYYQAAAVAANQFVQSDLGAGATDTFDAIWIDRGHNLWGASLQAYAGANNIALTVPALVSGAFVPGGDPTSSVMCVTEEGSAWSLVSAPAVAQTMGLRVVTSMQPILTGLVLGKRSQLLNYSSKRDEDAGGRTERSQESDAGYLAVERTYAYRTCELSLDLIGAAEYDSTIRSLRATLFERNQPAVIVMNYGDKPERGWLMQYQGKGWSSPMMRAHRKWTGTFREVGAVIR